MEPSGLDYYLPAFLNQRLFLQDNLSIKDCTDPTNLQLISKSVLELWSDESSAIRNAMIFRISLYNQLMRIMLDKMPRIEMSSCRKFRRWVFLSFHVDRLNSLWNCADTTIMKYLRDDLSGVGASYVPVRGITPRYPKPWAEFDGIRSPFHRSLRFRIEGLGFRIWWVIAISNNQSKPPSVNLSRVRKCMNHLLQTRNQLSALVLTSAHISVEFDRHVVFDCSGTVTELSSIQRRN